MIEYRKLSTLTEEEAEILVLKCFDGKLKKIIQLDDEKVVLKIETSGWDINDSKNPEGAMADEISFSVGLPGGYPLVDTPFSDNGEDEGGWQEFMIFYGFHPYYHDNIFEQKTQQEEKKM